MRTKSVLIAIAFLGGSSAASQTVIDVEDEPQHRHVLENPYVRVFDVALPPGYVGAFHRHSRDSISVRIATDMMRVDLLDAEGKAQVQPIGRVAFTAARPPYVHRVANVGESTIRIVNVEFLAGTGRGAESTSDGPSDHVIVLENDAVRVFRIRRSAGEGLPAHSHVNGRVTVMVSGPEPGQVAWHAGGGVVPAVAAGRVSIEMVEVEPK